MQQKMGKRLVLFPFPLVGHQNPMFELGNNLYSRGFSISVIHTKFNSPNLAKYPNFSFHFFDEGLLESKSSFDEWIDVMNMINKNCGESLKACLSQILTDALDVEEPVACLVTDGMLHFTQAVADHLKVPRICLRTGNMTSFTLFFANADLYLKENEPGDLIPERPPLRFKDMARLLNTGDQSPLLELLSNVVRQTKASKGLIFNSFEEIEDRSLSIIQQEFSIPIFPIGPFHKYLPTQHQNSLSWLDTQAPDSVLYVSFGSIASIDQTEFLEMANGLANSNQPFLWVIRSDLVHSLNGSSQLPDGFLDKVSGRGHVVGWAPQKEVLAHPAVGGFWTHCGWNSTLESICEGVPMICTHSFGDQMMDTRYVTDVWKIGLRLEKGTKTEDVEKAIRTLMADKEGEEMRKRAVCLKNKAANCLLPGGSSYKYVEDLVNLIMSF